MLNISDTLYRWCREDRPFALASVIRVSGSAPLPPGTALAVDTDGEAVGSISGGCVEGAVHELCRQVPAGGEPLIRASFGYSDSDAFAVGLTCGGERTCAPSPRTGRPPGRPGSQPSGSISQLASIRRASSDGEPGSAW